MKTCTHCGIQKELSEFHLEKRRHGYRSFCKACSAIAAKKWRVKNKDKEKSTSRLWYENNKEKRLEQCRIYQQANKDKKHENTRLWQKANREKCAEKGRRYRQNNLDKCREKGRLFQLKVRGTIKGSLGDSMSSGIRRSLKNNKNGYHWESLVGYSWQELKRSLEKQFKPGMSWNNYGEWHVDHKVPLCVFNITSVEDIDFKRAWALSNLQPLWKHDNLVKNGKIEKPFQPSLAMAI